MHNLEPGTTHEENEARFKGVPGWCEELCLLIHQSGGIFRNRCFFQH